MFSLSVGRGFAIKATKSAREDRDIPMVIWTRSEYRLVLLSPRTSSIAGYNRENGKLWYLKIHNCWVKSLYWDEWFNDQRICDFHSSKTERYIHTFVKNFLWTNYEQKFHMVVEESSLNYDFFFASIIWNFAFLIFRFRDSPRVVAVMLTI